MDTRTMTVSDAYEIVQAAIQLTGLLANTTLVDGKEDDVTSAANAAHIGLVALSEALTASAERHSRASKA